MDIFEFEFVEEFERNIIVNLKDLHMCTHDDAQ